MAELQTDPAGQLRRFVFEHQPIRGYWIRLDQAWRDLRAYRGYAPEVERLLGETATAAALLAATLKFEGRLTLQFQGPGPVSLLVAQCTHQYEIRALARTGTEAHSAGATLQDLIGRDGRMTVTIENDRSDARYQGIVALDGTTLAACLESYFENSEQLPTRIALLAQTSATSGLLLQQMPAAGGAQAPLLRVWAALQERLAGLPASLLQLGTAEEVLSHVCGEHDCRLFGAQSVRFACRCSQGRVARLLRAMELDEMRSILAEQGAVTVTCEFCGRPYRFDAVDIERLFADGVSLEAPPTVN